MDLDNKQLTVDFVNQSATQHGQLDADGIQPEKTDFAEKLGCMNQYYQTLYSDVTEKLKVLELMQLKWQEYDKGVNNINNWLSDQLAKVAKFCRIGHEISVQHALKECKVNYFTFTLF